MPKRKNSSIKEYKLKSGAKRYYFKISLGTNSYGKRIVTTRRGFKSYAEAEEAFNQLSIKKADDFVKQKQITVDELFTLYFKTYKANTKEVSAFSQNSQYKNHIKPFFGGRYIDQVTTLEIQQWANKLAHEIVEARRNISFLENMYEYARKNNMIESNPVSKIIKPKYKKPSSFHNEENVYTEKELTDFLNTAKEVSPIIFTYFKLLASTGLRKSEALALKWEDIDLDKKTINVNKTISYGPNFKIITHAPKTKASIRTIPFSDTLKNVLIKYRDNYSTSSKIVFANRRGAYFDTARPGLWLKRVYKKNPDLPQITPHGFRHTFATLLIENTNIKPKTVQMLLGHSTISMTLNLYTHINENNFADANQAFKNIGF